MSKEDRKPKNRDLPHPDDDKSHDIVVYQDTIAKLEAQTAQDQQQIAQLNNEIAASWKLLWLLANRRSGKLTFSVKELNTMKDGGKISRTVDDDGVVTVEAL